MSILKGMEGLDRVTKLNQSIINPNLASWLEKSKITLPSTMDQSPIPTSLLSAITNLKSTLPSGIKFEGYEGYKGLYAFDSLIDIAKPIDESIIDALGSKNIIPDSALSVATDFSNLSLSLHDQMTQLSNYKLPKVSQLDIVLGGMTQSMNYILASSIALQDWGTLADINIDLENIVDWSEKVNQKPEIEKVDYEKIAEIVEAVVVKYVKEKDNKDGNRVSNFLAVLSIILSLMQILGITPADYSTNQKLEESNKKITQVEGKLSKVEKQFELSQDSLRIIRQKDEIILENQGKLRDSLNVLMDLLNTRWVNTNTILRGNPKRKSINLGSVSKGQEVKILARNHKWIKITFNDPKTGEIKIGWCMKKYFDKD